MINYNSLRSNPAGGFYEGLDGTPGLTCQRLCYGDGCNVNATADTPA